MTPEELTGVWNVSFPDVPPIPCELKTQVPERWFRIHGLPGSKRYAESKDEYDEIFERPNVILSDLVGEGGAYCIISLGYGDRPDNPARDAQLEKMNLQTHYWMSMMIDEDTPDFRWYWWYDEQFWQTNSQNPLLRLVADDEARNVMFFQPEKKFVYHPYDGGADVLFCDRATRDFYRRKYKGWLSDHPQGF